MHLVLKPPWSKSTNPSFLQIPEIWPVRWSRALFSSSTFSENTDCQHSTRPRQFPANNMRWQLLSLLWASASFSTALPSLQPLEFTRRAQLSSPIRVLLHPEAVPERRDDDYHTWMFKEGSTSIETSVENSDATVNFQISANDNELDGGAYKILYNRFVSSLG